MKNLTISLFYICLAFSFLACFDYEVQFEGSYEDDASDDQAISLDKEVVFVAGGKVYLANAFLEELEVIEAEGNVRIASINNNHTKVIYKKTDSDILIYDIENQEIEGSIPNTRNAIWFDFHSNNESIYFLTSNGKLDTHGPEIIAKRPLNLSVLHGIGARQVTGVVVFENGEFIYSMVSASILNTPLAIRSDGLDLKWQKDLGFNGALSDMRANLDETSLWTGSHYGDRMNRFFLPSLSNRDIGHTRLMGAPINYDSGYRVSDEHAIRGPNSFLESPEGKITAIDY